MERSRPSCPDRTPPLAGGRRLAVLFDWGDTVMRVFPQAVGPMVGWTRVEAVAGVRRAFFALRPHAVLGLATNAADSDVAQIRAALRRVRLSSCLARIYCFRALGVRKPTPVYFQAVLADLGLPPQRVVMVGDDWEADIEGALAAGLWAVWYDPQRRGGRSHKRVRVLHEMGRLPELLADWGLT